MPGHDVASVGAKRRSTVTATTKRRAGGPDLAEALGASAVTHIQHAVDTPLGFVAVRQALVDTRRSTGGRPGFADAERHKIPVPAAVWQLVSDAARR